MYVYLKYEGEYSVFQLFCIYINTGMIPIFKFTVRDKYNKRKYYIETVEKEVYIVDIISKCNVILKKWEAYC